MKVGELRPGVTDIVALDTARLNLLEDERELCAIRRLFVIHDARFIRKQTATKKKQNKL